jgi:type II secretory ATPase GspE/PulE/Tfp pilus assembly ATPase PilB-like protein
MRENHKLKEQAEKKSKEIKKLAKYARINQSQLLSMLMKSGHLNADQKEKVQRARSQSQKPLTDVIIEMGYMKESELASFLKSKVGADRLYPKEFSPPDVLLSLFPEELCRKSHVFPLKHMEGGKVLLVMSDPSDFALVDNMRFLTGMEIVPGYAPGKEIEEVIDDFFERKDSSGASPDLSQIQEYEPYETIEIVLEEEEESVEDLMKSSETPPAIKLVNVIILEALKSRASDIHLEKRVKHTAVRFRIDGLLTDHIHIPENLHQALVSRIKVMAELDISERRRPQDGRITVKSSLRTVDLRISTLPTINGEKVVMRILDRNAVIKSASDLGADPQDIERMVQMVKSPQGMILTTGPTGSGKTTTLYALLYEHANPSMNYVTIEDPVEYYLEYAGQVLVKEKIGLNFASILRSILRQDPNVILLGEVRDFETAEVSFHAALTGHLVLSTLHTTSTVGTVARLLDLGVKPYIIASGLTGIIAQRLVRKLCNNCKEEIEPDPKVLKYLGIEKPEKVYVARGCKQCNNTGFNGRLGLYEVLIITPRVRQIVARNFSEGELSQVVREEGMRTLLETGVDKAEKGLTSLEEILRVLGPQESHIINCPKCHSVAGDGDNYCPQCGEFLMQSCPACGRSLESEWKFCPGCGKSYEHNCTASLQEKNDEEKIAQNRMAKLGR